MERIEVRVSDCACPDRPHTDGDVVYINAKLSALGGIAAEQEIGRGARNDDELTQRLLLSFARSEAVGWNRTERFDIDELMGDWTLARPVVIAGERYIKAAIAPFQTRPAERSPTGRTPASTSRTRKPTPSPSE